MKIINGKHSYLIADLFSVKRLNKSILRLFFLFLIFPSNVHSQKLPSIQKKSLKVPINLQVDGISEEWSNAFQAYNKATNIFYTIANDETRLCFVLYTPDPEIIKKIVMNGLTVNIYNTDAINGNQNLSITYPQYERNAPPFYLDVRNKVEKKHNPIENNKIADSVMKDLNGKLSNKIKLIGVSGIKAISDSSISIYNDYEVEAASLFNNKISYTIELSIPLKYCNQNQASILNYTLQLNGIKDGNVKTMSSSKGNYLFYNVGGIDYSMLATPENMLLAYPTKFSGKYVLINK